MIYCVFFEDDPRHADQRAKHMQAHLAFLKANAQAIDAAGPLTDSASGTPAGGLWVVRAPDADAVRTLVEADPFWPTGLRKSVRILEWKQVFSNR
ncbi:MAG TPA: YciI family protein [Methylomirabilota bacterium]|jgi:uncharacterized protein|nr:YciI family protein [Methylomirabilota bacterium]